MPRGALSRSERSEIEASTEIGRRQEKVPGLALGLIRSRTAVLAQGWGFRDREAETPATSRTVFGLASLTKSFTALTLLRLAEQGSLRIEDPVVRWLPEYRTPHRGWAKRTRLHHFLTHSSGLPPLPSIYYSASRSFALDLPYDPAVARRVGIETDHPPIDTYDELLAYLATEHYRPLGPPGAQYSYSNEGFGLLGAVIERATGRPYETVVEEELLRPAGMRSTVFDPGVLFRQAEVTRLYSPDRRHPGRGLRGSDVWWEQTCMRAGGALRSNVDDLLRYLEIFLRGGRVGRERILDAASVERMMRPHIEMRPGLSYGYGLMIVPDSHGTLLIEHGGALPGVSAHFAVLPRKGMGGVLLSNREGADAGRILRGPFNVLTGRPARALFAELPPREPVSVPLTEYGGWYCSGEGIWVKVTPRRDHLRLDLRGIELVAGGLRLRPIGPDRFVLRIHGSPSVVSFLRDPSGRLYATDLGGRIVRRRTPRELTGARRGAMVW